MCRQVFVAWCCYVDSQRRKAARYSQALDIYRRRLLTEGATKWLSVSSDLSHLRMKYATEKGVQVIAALHLRFFQCIIVTCNLFVNLIDRVTEHVVAKWFGDL